VVVLVVLPPTPDVRQEALRIEMVLMGLPRLVVVVVVVVVVSVMVPSYPLTLMRQTFMRGLLSTI